MMTTFSEDMQIRAEDLADLTTRGSALIGLTIASVKAEPHDQDCDAANVLLLTFTDGSMARIWGGYRGYTGSSCDEYPETIDLHVTRSDAPGELAT